MLDLRTQEGRYARGICDGIAADLGGAPNAVQQLLCQIFGDDPVPERYLHLSPVVGDPARPLAQQRPKLVKKPLQLGVAQQRQIEETGPVRP